MEPLVEQAVAFLRAPSAAAASVEQKTDFLRKKGLSDAQIHEAIRQSKGPAPENPAPDSPAVPERPDFVRDPAANQAMTAAHYEHLVQLLQAQDAHVRQLALAPALQLPAPRPASVRLAVLRQRRPFWRALVWALSLGGLAAAAGAFVVRSCLARLLNGAVRAQEQRRGALAALVARLAALVKMQRAAIAPETRRLDAVEAGLAETRATLAALRADLAAAAAPSDDPEAAVDAGALQQKLSKVTRQLTAELYVNGSGGQAAPADGKLSELKAEIRELKGLLLSRRRTLNGSSVESNDSAVQL